eukprot:6297549-Heterocapsa_arctica.AAC.1
MLNSDGTLRVSSDAQEVIVITQPGSGTMLLTFMNSKAKSTNCHWAFGLYDNHDILTFSRRSASGDRAEARMQFETSGN